MHDQLTENKEFLKIEQHSDSRSDRLKSQAKTVLFEAFRLHQSSVSVDIKLTAGKAGHVYAADTYEANQLKLVPYTTNVIRVATATEKETTPSKQYIRLKLKMNGTQYIITMLAASALKPDKSSKPLSKDLIVPYWLVRSTSDKDEANMCHSAVDVRIASSMHQVSMPILGDLATVPIMQNTKLLAYLVA